jgi:hypothetical protein
MEQNRYAKCHHAVLRQGRGWWSDLISFCQQPYTIQRLDIADHGTAGSFAPRNARRVRDQSFSGTSAAFSFDSTGAGASSAGAAAGLRDAGASSAGALSVKASIKVVFFAFDFRVGRRHADFHLRPLRKTLPMGPR